MGAGIPGSNIAATWICPVWSGPVVTWLPVWNGHPPVGRTKTQVRDLPARQIRPAVFWPRAWLVLGEGPPRRRHLGTPTRGPNWPGGTGWPSGLPQSPLQCWLLAGLRLGWGAEDWWNPPNVNTGGIVPRPAIPLPRNTQMVTWQPT